MITIKDFMEAVNYRVTEGSEFVWKCFGPHAYRLDSWNGEVDGYTISILFDTQTQEVYQAEAYDYAANCAYRLQNWDHFQAHIDEAEARGVDPNEALQDDNGTPIKFIDLEVDADFLEKARAIVLGEEYDRRVQIEVEFNDENLLQYMKLAHDMDITFNELVERALVEKIKELENK